MSIARLLHRVGRGFRVRFLVPDRALSASLASLASIVTRSPIVVGNFANAVITSSVLLRIQMDYGSASGWLVLVALLLYLVVFIRLTFWPPFKEDRKGAAG